jgi:hypothetical protein
MVSKVVNAIYANMSSMQIYSANMSSMQIYSANMSLIYCLLLYVLVRLIWYLKVVTQCKYMTLSDHATLYILKLLDYNGIKSCVCKCMLIFYYMILSIVR